MTKPQTSENANAPAVARRALEKASASVAAGASDSLMPWATSARYLMHTNSMTRETTRTTVRSPCEEHARLRGEEERGDVHHVRKGDHHQREAWPIGHEHRHPAQDGQRPAHACGRLHDQLQRHGRHAKRPQHQIDRHGGDADQEQRLGPLDHLEVGKHGHDQKRRPVDGKAEQSEFLAAVGGPEFESMSRAPCKRPNPTMHSTMRTAVFLSTSFCTARPFFMGCLVRSAYTTTRLHAPRIPRQLAHVHVPFRPPARMVARNGRLFPAPRPFRATMRAPLSSVPHKMLLIR